MLKTDDFVYLYMLWHSAGTSMTGSATIITTSRTLQLGGSQYDHEFCICHFQAAANKILMSY